VIYSRTRHHRRVIDAVVHRNFNPGHPRLAARFTSPITAQTRKESFRQLPRLSRLPISYAITLLLDIIIATMSRDACGARRARLIAELLLVVNDFLAVYLLRYNSDTITRRHRLHRACFLGRSVGEIAPGRAGISNWAVIPK